MNEDVPKRRVLSGLCQVYKFVPKIWLSTTHTHTHTHTHTLEQYIIYPYVNWLSFLDFFFKNFI